MRNFYENSDFLVTFFAMINKLEIRCDSNFNPAEQHIFPTFWDINELSRALGSKAIVLTSRIHNPQSTIRNPGSGQNVIFGHNFWSKRSITILFSQDCRAWRGGDFMPRVKPIGFGNVAQRSMLLFFEMDKFNTGADFQIVFSKISMKNK